MEPTNLFDLFGIEAPKPVEKKAESKIKKKAAPAKKEVKKEVYKLPLTLYTGYREPCTITSDSGEETVTLADLKKRISEVTGIAIPVLAMSFSKDKKAVCAAVSRKKEQVKGEIKISEDTVLILPHGEKLSDLSTVLDATEGNVSIEKIREFCQSILNSAAFEHGISLVPNGKELYVLFAGQKLGKEKLAFPVTVTVFGNEDILITEEEYIAFLEKENADSREYTAENFTKCVLQKFPVIGEHMVLQHGKNTKTVNVSVVIQETTTVAKDTKTYPANAKLYIMSTAPIELNSDLFGGKSKITEEDVINYAHDNISPIFKKDRCGVTYYKDDNVLYLTMKGSSKGARELVTEKERFGELLKKEYALFEYQSDEGLFYVEKNPALCCMASVEEDKKGKYIPQIPKLPGSLYQKLQTFFETVAEKYHTEVMVRVFWNSDMEEFEVELPKQEVTPSTVREDENDRFNVFAQNRRIPVAEFHSHCRFRAYFSSMDDADEVMALTYGVWGSFLTGDPYDIMFVARSSAGGKTFPITKEMIFTEEEASFGEIQKFVSEYMEKAKTAFTVYK